VCAVKQTEREKEGECMRESKSRERETHRGGFVTISFLILVCIVAMKA